jgi:hypothetical protein
MAGSSCSCCFELKTRTYASAASKYDNFILGFVAVKPWISSLDGVD